MGSVLQPRKALRFGVFELDVETGDLRKNGLKIKLQDQPYQVLAILLERPGEVVTREEICQRLWADGTFVEFDRSLNVAITKIRDALGDSASSPRFLETVPRRGYRFIAPVENLGETASATAAPPQSVSPSRRTPRAWIVAAAAFAAVAGVVWYSSLGRKANHVAPQVLPLTSFPGQELYATFSPDGDDIAFAWNGEKRDNFDIYRLLIGATEPLRLTTDPAEDFSPAWSPDGKWIAFKRLLGGGRTAVFVIPATGGVERRIADGHDERLGCHANPRSPSLAWTPDSKSLILSDRASISEPFGLFLYSIDTREKQRLTAPSNEVWGDVGPAVSPDGQTLAFCRMIGYTSSDLHLVPLREALVEQTWPKHLLTNADFVASPLWRPGRNEIVITGGSMGTRNLWSIATSGSSVGHPFTVGADGDLPALSPRGHRLAYSKRIWDANIWRLRISAGSGPTQTPVPLIHTTRDEIFPTFSPDGARIAYQSDRSGTHEVWISDSNGLGSVQLTSFGRGMTGSPHWSPDGQRIAFDSSAEGQFDIYVVDAAGGKPARLTQNSHLDVIPRWSGDGEWIYFTSKRTGTFQVWKMPAAGSEIDAVQVTNAGGGPAFESPDGAHLYYTRIRGALDGDADLCRVPVNGGPEVTVDVSVVGRHLAVTRDGIWYVRWPAGLTKKDWHIGTRLGKGDFSVWFHSFATGTARRVVSLTKDPLVGFTASADNRFLLWSQVDRQDDDLMLVENFDQLP